MIPQIIHCIWLGGPKTKLAQKCLASWKRFAPDWEIREWGMGKEGMGLRSGPAADVEVLVPFADVPEYVKKALSAKKWAFAADWLRFVALEREGGVYFDCDVELTRPLTCLPEGEWIAGEWVCNETAIGMNPCAIALGRGSDVAERMLSVYRVASFTIDKTVGDLMAEADIKMTVLPPEVFCPFDHCHRSLRTERTVGVHHYALSWITPQRRLARWLNWHGMGRVTEVMLKLRG